MILSFWRYSHLSLAICSTIFLIIASITGSILSFSSIKNEINSNNPGDISNISISSFLKNISNNYNEITEINIEDDGFIQTTILNADGELKTFYVNAKNGKKIGSIEEESKIFSFCRKLHRSLFFKKTGRIIVGICSFLLFLIAISGSFLIIKRQLSIKKYFSKVTYDNFFQYWHTVIGRYSIFIIVVIALTGSYLSLERFKLIPQKIEAAHKFDIDKVNDSLNISIYEFEIFKQTKLSELEFLKFPFTPFIEDHFNLKLHNKDLIINQYNGDILSEIDFGTGNKISQLSYNLHTGKGSVSWSIILCICSISILFFIYSGFNISWKRIRSKKKNIYTREKSNYLILVGSENGNTMRFARQIYDLLILNRKKVHIDYLNNFKGIHENQNLIIISSTYGEGDPPHNAKKFTKRLKQFPIKNNITYSVVGFGSKKYPDFCKYAINLDSLFQKNEFSNCNTPIHLVNKQSQKEFEKWKKEWCQNNEIKYVNSKIDVFDEFEKFKVVGVTNPKSNPNQTFKLLLKPKNNKLVFESGDLIAFKPMPEQQERLYSIGKSLRGYLLLYIKKHDAGLCSTYLSKLKKGDSINGKLIVNEKFHVDIESKQLILIANGTGIAPFIGMASENKNNKRINIYWGGKSKKSYELYKNKINKLIKIRRINSISKAYSKDKKRYVQDLLVKDRKYIAGSLKNGCQIMICGSIEMEKDVLKILNKITLKYHKKPLSEYQENNQVKTDCY